MSRLRWIVGVIFCLAGAASAFSEPARQPARQNAEQGDTPARRPAAELTASAIQKRLRQVERATNLDEAVPKCPVEEDNTGLQHLKTAEQHYDRAASDRQRA